MKNQNLLYLQDVRSPKKKIYPVMVFIHGGSLTSGDSKSSSFGPEYLMDKDIVLVIFNYRLGLLGNLIHTLDVRQRERLLEKKKTIPNSFEE